MSDRRRFSPEKVTEMNRNNRLIKKKVYKYLLTGIMTTVAFQLGNIVDAMIVGNLLGSLGNGAISASVPYVYILQAAAMLLANGGAVLSAVSLGKRDAASAGKIMGFCLLAGTLYPLIFTAASPGVVPLFVSFTAAEGELKEMISGFSMVHSFGMPAISFVIIISYFMNIDNHPGLSAGLNITANAVNLGLDFLLVKFTPLGIRGAALSTSLGYITAGCIFIPIYLKSKKRMIKPTLKGLSQSWELIRRTVVRGLPVLSFLLMTVIGMSIINRSVLSALGSKYYSAYAVINNTQTIVTMCINGITSVIASVAGVLYGEKDYFGMRAVFSRVTKITLATGAVIVSLFLAVPQLFAALYGFKDQEIMPSLLTGMRVFSLSFGFFVLNSLTQNYYRTIGRTFLSVLDTVLELLVFKVPLMIAGLHLFGFIGLFAAIIVSECLSLVTTDLVRIVLQKKGRVPQKGFMAIPERSEGEICDMTVSGSDEQAVDVSKLIIGYCRKENMDERQANILGLAAEELVSNIGRYGYTAPGDRDIDICLSRDGSIFCLRLRDDGIPFDPAAYEPETDDPERIGGLRLLKSMKVKMNYMRVINLNNTIIEIDCGKGAEQDD